MSSKSRRDEKPPQRVQKKAEVAGGANTDQQENAVRVLLAEYEGLCEEIRARTTSQTQVMLVGASVIAALVGPINTMFNGGTHLDQARLLLAVACLCAALVLLIVNLDQDIMDIARYIDRYIRPALSEKCGSEMLQYQDFLRERRPSRQKHATKNLRRMVTSPGPHIFFLVVGWLAIGAVLFIATSRVEFSTPYWGASIGTAAALTYSSVASVLIAGEYGFL